MIYNIITIEQENGKITRNIKKGFSLDEAIRYIQDKHKQVEDSIGVDMTNELLGVGEYTRVIVRTPLYKVLCRIEQDMDDI